MKKLTIKELAPYAPYGLDVVLGSTVRNLTDISLDSPFVFVTAYKGSREKQMAGIENIKPLLRPLSSITQEIEHNGERFIPINKLKHLYGWDYLWYEVLGEITNFNVNKLKYACLKLLLEWHFDVFGLIERGIALPIDGKEVEGE